MAAVEPSAAPIVARRPSETKTAAPTRAPEAARPSRGGREVRLGVAGSLSPTSSPSSIRTSTFERRGEPRKAKRGTVEVQMTMARGAADEGRTGERAQARDGAETEDPGDAHASALPYGRVSNPPLRSYARALHTSSLVLMWRMISSVNSVVPAEPPRSAVFTPSRTVSKVAS